MGMTLSASALTLPWKGNETMKSRAIVLLIFVGMTAGYVGAQTVIGSQLQAVSSGGSSGVAGEIDSINTSKTTSGTAYRWSIYNMTGSYGNSLQFWDYDSISCSPGGMCSPRLTLMDSGNVGIGTTSPQVNLDVETETSAYGANIANFGVTDSKSVLHIVAIGANQSRSAIGTTSNDDFALFTNNGTDNLHIQASTGNVGIGTTAPGAKLEVNGNVKLTSGSGASITFADSTVQSTAFTGVLCGGDYAESVDIDGDRADVEPGDVLVLDKDNQDKVLKSAEPYSTMVAGIFSTRPGVVGRRQKTPKSSKEIPMAMVGIVPTKVSAENGPIKVGDLLVSSSRPGYAMRGTDRSRMLGAVIGKSMGTLKSGTGTIEVLVALQ